MGEKVQVAAKKPEVKRENQAPHTRNADRSQSMSSPIDRVLFLQRTIGNQAVQQLIKSGTLQAKLKIGQPGDKYEQEADRVADAVMRMPEPGVQRQVKPEEEEEEMLQSKPLVSQITPLVQVQRQEEPEEEEETLQAKPLAEEITPLVQRQLEPEEEEEELQAKASSSHISEVNPNFESHIQSFKGGGQPLSEDDRTYFEPRFGRDFSQVRVHTDAKAAEAARGLKSRAFTMGNNVVFGEGQYVPRRYEGQKLLAHELSHVVQQTGAGIQQLVQRSCVSPRPEFLLVSNHSLGMSIHDALSGETENIPDPVHQGQFIQRVRVNPDHVIEILNSSNCLKHNAQTVEARFFGGQSPQLTVEAFNPRSEPARRSEFVPGDSVSPSMINVGVASNLADAVQIIVHELVHATPVNHRFQGSESRRQRDNRPQSRVRMEAMAQGAGAVTMAERRRVREEALTRDREAEIMEEIRNNNAWINYTGGAEPHAIGYQPEDVRGSFISGLPKLTYQEFFILEEMKERYRSALGSMDEQAVHSAARGMVQEGEFTLGSVSSFRMTVERITFHRERTAWTPVRPPPPSAAGDCINIYNRHSRSLEGASTELRSRHQRCPSFIELFERNLATPFDTHSEAGRERVFDMFLHMQYLYRVRTSARQASEHFITWYDSWHSLLSPEDREDENLQSNVLHFFEWVLIAEKMSSGWSSHVTPDQEIRRHNLDFLVSAAGGSQSGELTGQRGLLTEIANPQAASESNE